jgi:hypothetical protein
MWARMPITALVGDTILDEWPEAMTPRLCQPWDCSSRNHQVHIYDRTSSSPWICKINGEFHTGRYMFTVDYTDSHISDDPAQHKQSHVLELTDAGIYTRRLKMAKSKAKTTKKPVVAPAKAPAAEPTIKIVSKADAKAAAKAVQS